MPFFSIVVPVYNNENIYICLESILKQSFIDFELIIINDGSTDKTADIINKTIKDDNRAVVYSYENAGLATARNRGLEKCNGKYIWMIDSDDYIEINALQIIYNIINKNKSDLVIFDFYIVDEKGRKLKNKYISYKLRRLKEVVSAIELINAYLDRKIHSYACFCIVKKELYHGISYPDGQNYEDVQTTYKIFSKVKHASVIKQKLYFYVQSPKSITHTVTKKNIRDFQKAGRVLCEDLGKNKTFKNKVNKFYVGILINSYFNMRKIDKEEAVIIARNIKKIKKLNGLNIFHFADTPYFFKLVFLELTIV